MFQSITDTQFLDMLYRKRQELCYTKASIATRIYKALMLAGYLNEGLIDINKIKNLTNEELLDIKYIAEDDIDLIRETVNALDEYYSEKLDPNTTTYIDRVHMIIHTKDTDYIVTMSKRKHNVFMAWLVDDVDYDTSDTESNWFHLEGDSRMVHVLRDSINSVEVYEDYDAFKYRIK